jgi:dienelactone hydrolase
MKHERLGRNERKPWDAQLLGHAPPRHYIAQEFEADGLQAVYYDALPYQGKATRVFAYCGFPKEAEGERVPAVVLVHGGGGTAFGEWVRIWNERGYAAIAMDLEGHLPVGKDEDGRRPRHPWSGPSRQGEFGDYRLSPSEQWMYHAVADVILAHSLIRSFPQVDPDRVGVTGISWGGIVTSIVAGVDERFRFAIPVYGCGYLFEAGNVYEKAFTAMGEEEERIRNLWDPSAYLPDARLPMLWVNGTNDAHFPLTIFGKSYEMAKRNQPLTALSVIQGMKHGHEAGWGRNEIYVFADSIVKGGPAFARFEGQAREGRIASAELVNAVDGDQFRLMYAEEAHNWPHVTWQAAPAIYEATSGRVKAEVPEHAQAYFFQSETQLGLIASTAIQIIV